MTFKRILAASLLAASPALANEPADEILVVGSLAPISAEAFGASVTVLDSDTLELRNADFLSDLLRDVPSVALSRTGSYGGLTQVRIRGSEADHTLTLLDGMELSDPAVSFGFDYGAMTGFDVSRVEVLRGAGSAIHGSDALGGVIAISTPEPSSERLITAEARGGSFGTWAGGAAVGGAISNAVTGRLSLSHFDTDGINISRTGSENDGHKVSTAYGKLVGELSAATSFKLVSRYVIAETEIDAGTPVADANNHSESKAWNARAELAHALGANTEAKAFIEAARVAANHYQSGAFNRATRGSRVKYGVEATHFVGEHSLSGLIETERQSFNNISNFAAARQQKSRRTHSYAVEALLVPTHNTTLQLGARHDDNRNSGDSTTWRASGTYAVVDTPFTLHASAGTGVREPSFTELYGFFPATFQGNSDLKSEQALNKEIGVRSSWHEGAVVADITYFQSDIKDDINGSVFVGGGVFTAGNRTGTAKADGVEVSAAIAFESGARLSGHYTSMKAKNANGSQKIRRPEVLAAANLALPIFNGRGMADIGVDYTGAQLDTDFSAPFPFPNRTLDDYWLVNLSAQYQLNDKVELFARGDNLLDEDYQDVLFFNTPGRALFVGVRASLGD